jgi:hypothetical protein
MSHRAQGAVIFILACLAIVAVASAQEPSTTDAARVQPGPPTPPPAQTPKADTPAASDQSSNPAAPPAKTDSQSAAKTPLATIIVNIGPSADILRSARNAGFTVKIAGGTTHFCKTEAPIGTRFVSEHCMNEQQVTLFLERAQDQREKLSHLLGAPAVSH